MDKRTFLKHAGLIGIGGRVNCTGDFTDQSKVINGYSDFMVEISGEKGKHARASISLP